MTEYSSEGTNAARSSRNPIKSYFRWFRKLWFLKLLMFLVIAAIPPLLLIYVTIYMPLDNATQLGLKSSPAERTYIPAPPGLSTEQVSKVSQLEDLEYERTYLKNRLKLAGQDSIYLCLNIPESVITLEIKGVVARTAKIQKMSVSRRFSRIPRADIMEWMSAPFTLKDASATIPKSPIVFKQAPKDTLEAQATSTTPKPPELNSVFLTFQFDRDLLLEIEQVQPIPEDDKELIQDFVKEKRRAIARQALNSVLHFKPPEPELRIMLWLDDADARAIYRAIPQKAQMVVRL